MIFWGSNTDPSFHVISKTCYNEACFKEVEVYFYLHISVFMVMIGDVQSNQKTTCNISLFS